jgi:TolB-like protein
MTRKNCREMKKKIVEYLSAVIVLVLLSNPSFAEETMSNMISKKFSEKRDICLVISSLIQEGKTIKEVVKASINMGYNACFVAKCALEGGGNPEQIINGAIEAGVKSNVIAECAISVREKNDKIARVLEPSQVSRKIRIALFPFENLTDEKTALEQLMPVLRTQLEGKGLEIIDENSLNNILLKKRVRNTGYISKDLAQEVGKKLNVKAIMVGSINSFYLRENPQVGLLARLIDSSDGSILWANQASATGEDFTKILGLGTVKSMDRLISIVAERLFSSFSVTPLNKEKELTHRIAVMPFQNKSRHKDAGTIVTYMFLVELFNNTGFEPVEYGEIRKMVVDLRIRHKGELDYNSIKELSETLGVDGILVGTVMLYSDGLDTSSPPQVAVSARLINARKNRIIWSDSLQVNGNEDIIVLDWGKIRSVDNVAYKVVSKLVQKMEKAKWQ